MQIFAYTESHEFQTLLEVECRELTGQRPVVHNCLDELQGIMDVLESVDVLILDYPNESEKIVDVKEFLLRISSKVKNGIVYGGHNSNDPSFKVFDRTEITRVFDELKCLIGEAEITNEEWSSVPLSTMVHFQHFPFDLYIKISEGKYVKRVHAFEVVGEDLISTLKNKGVFDLYYPKKHKREFSMMLINNMINRVEKVYDSLEEEVKAQDEVFKTTRNIIHSLGLTGRVIEVCDSAIDKMMSEVRTNGGELSRYLVELREDKSLAFQFKLINLTNYIGTQIITGMELSNEDVQIRKFIYASFFCDMAIKKSELLYHRSVNDGKDLSLEDQNEVNFHALKASEMMLDYPGIAKEVALIVRQHHGSFSGIGFPEERSGQLLPLSKVLIVAQELAYAILTEQDLPVAEVLKKFLNRKKTPGMEALLAHLGETLKSAS